MGSQHAILISRTDMEECYSSKTRLYNDLISLGGVARGKQELEGRYRGIPLQRLGTKREIAECAVFVASPAASYVTGHTLVVDGGSWMTSDNKREIMRRIQTDAKL